jgi:tRNA G26 N,N-dimethylase Trm1
LLLNQKQRQRRAELSREQKMRFQQNDSQQHKQRRAALSLEKKRQVNQENNKTTRKGQQHTRKCSTNTGLEPLSLGPLHDRNMQAKLVL